jgi:large subunit ribosomal protein L32
MGLPKRKTSHAAQGDRRAHLALSAPNLEACPHCHEQKLAHHACPNCGYYGGREAVRIRAKATGGESPKS